MSKKKLFPCLLIVVIGSIGYYKYNRTEKHRKYYVPLDKRKNKTGTNLDNIRKYKNLSDAVRKTSTFDAKDGIDHLMELSTPEVAQQYLKRLGFLSRSYSLNSTTSHPYKSSTLKVNAKDGIQHLTDLSTPEDALPYLKRLGFLSRSYSLNSTASHPVILFAASSNHSRELLDFLYELNSIILPVYPTLKRIFYNLGLTSRELLKVKNMCGCEIRYFPFESYPVHVKGLKTYAWKPIIIQTVLQQYHFVMYMDTSIRFNKTGNITDLWEITKNTGFMYLQSSGHQFLQHTLPQTFQFFDVDMYQFQGLPEYQATMVLIHDNWLTHYIFMKWWVTCAVTQNCIAPPNSDKMLHCDTTVNQISICHRFDQSALNVLINLISPNPLKQFISRSYVYVKMG